ncbi:hypothetical protein RchiOBHm_Chr4g0394081 [Rosa chinensis]|uniref:Uncharacterized protein n=1 Tax=Rosa chinensis TaxID=74649 RepID=A0A2P6QR56_ROSCH|nr:hypothetical protein RchiOBHm_Chr4g0394081 [Rosa chinensis]
MLSELIHSDNSYYVMLSKWKARTLHSWFALFDSSSSCDSVKLGDSSLEKFVFDFWNHGSIALAKNSRLSPLPPERAGFNYGIGETVDIPIDGSGDLKKRERELQAKEAKLRKCEEAGVSCGNETDWNLRSESIRLPLIKGSIFLSMVFFYNIGISLSAAWTQFLCMFTDNCSKKRLLLAHSDMLEWNAKLVQGLLTYGIEIDNSKVYNQTTVKNCRLIEKLV